MLPARTAACCALVTALLAPGVASAQGPRAAAPTAQESARSLAEAGLKLFGKDRFTEAFEKFQAADALFHAPSLVLYMARCQRKLGKLLAARETYERILAEPVAKNAPAAYLEAQADAKKELEALRGRIPTLQIVITGLSGPTRATIDGAPAPVAKERVELDPGPHAIEAMAEGGTQVEKREVTLAEGGAEKLEIAFGAKAAPNSAPAEPAPAAARKGSILPGVIGLGVGGAALVTGAITGAMSLGKVSDIKSHCKDTACPTSQQSAADSARTLGTVSTATFVVGGVVAAAGAVLLVIRPGGGAQPASAASGFTWSAGVGLGHVDVQGRF